jgi:hypothetical protein
VQFWRVFSFHPSLHCPRGFEVKYGNAWPTTTTPLSDGKRTNLPKLLGYLLGTNITELGLGSQHIKGFNRGVSQKGQQLFWFANGRFVDGFLADRTPNPLSDICTSFKTTIG